MFFRDSHYQLFNCITKFWFDKSFRPRFYERGLGVKSFDPFKVFLVKIFDRCLHAKLWRINNKHYARWIALSN